MTQYLYEEECDELPAFRVEGLPSVPRLSHLEKLEAESIHIFREAAASFAAPVMLYSIGKDSSVLLRLAQKAFYPGKFRSRCCMSILATNSPR